MKANEIVIGGTYIAKVSGKLVRVRVIELECIEQRTYVGLLGNKVVFRARQRFLCDNLDTGRRVTFKTAAKFRRAVS